VCRSIIDLYCIEHPKAYINTIFSVEFLKQASDRIRSEVFQWVWMLHTKDPKNADKSGRKLKNKERTTYDTDWLWLTRHVMCISF
jgi:hypothetical protein